MKTSAAKRINFDVPMCDGFEICWAVLVSIYRWVDRISAEVQSTLGRRWRTWCYAEWQRYLESRWSIDADCWIDHGWLHMIRVINKVAPKSIWLGRKAHECKERLGGLTKSNTRIRISKFPKTWYSDTLQLQIAQSFVFDGQRSNTKYHDYQYHTERSQTQNGGFSTLAQRVSHEPIHWCACLVTFDRSIHITGRDRGWKKIGTWTLSTLGRRWLTSDIRFNGDSAG